jgi:CRP/FNR family nitrogen fixation transcriptional regulator
MLATLAQYAETPRATALLGAAIPPLSRELPHGRAHPQPVMHFAQDSGIYEEGDDATCFYKIVSGVVRTCRFSADGRRHIDAFYKPGDIFGFELGLAHRFSAEAVTDCAVIVCRRRGMEEAVAHDGAAVLELYGYAMRQLDRARSHSQLLGRCSAMQKLAVFLLEISERRRSGDIELPMTRQDIADYLGLTIETVSRTFAQLEKNQVIRLRAARKIELKDRAALEDLAA